MASEPDSHLMYCSVITLYFELLAWTFLALRKKEIDRMTETYDANTYNYVPQLSQTRDLSRAYTKTNCQIL